MSGADIDPLAIASPDLYVKNLAIQRRQALAQSLLEQGSQNTGSQTYGGLRGAGNALLGAYLLKRSDKDMAGIIPQISAAYNGSPQQSQPQSDPGQDQVLGQRYGADAASQITNMPQSSPQAPQGQQPPQQQGGQGTGIIQTIPGMSFQQSQHMFLFDRPGYWKALSDALAPTPAMKDAAYANPGNPEAARQSVGAQNTKAGTLEFREKGFGVLPNGKVIYGPNEESNTYFTTGPNNEPIAHGIQGGAEVAAAQAAAIEKAREGQKIIPDVPLSTGARVPMTGQQALGQVAPPSGVMGQQSQPAPRSLTQNALLDRKISQAGSIDKAIASAPDDATANALADRYEETMKIGSYAPQPQIGQTTIQKESQEEIGKASGLATSNNAHIQATTAATLKAIDGLIALNDKVPDSAGLPPQYKAALDKRAPSLSRFLGTGGDAGALAQWEQLSSQGVLGGIKQLGLGRLDIPIVKQIQESNGIPADLPRGQRIALLQQLRTAIINNQSVAQNISANLNNPGVGGVSRQAPISGYNQNQPSSPQDIVDELRRRGLVK